MKDYIRKINYYETDKMGITHHSNYIRFMEEARMDFMAQLGFDYARLERDGIISPVIGIEGAYKKSTTFGDVLIIHIKVESYSGVKLVVGYTMTIEGESEPSFIGKSTHCFTDANGVPIIVKKKFTEFDAALKGLRGLE